MNNSQIEIQQKNYRWMAIEEINKDFIEKIKQLIINTDDDALLTLLAQEHPADIAEIIDLLNLNNATYLFKLLDSEKTAEALMEIDEDDREKILQNLSAEEIAEEIDELDTDDAADIIAELPKDRKTEVISEIEDDLSEANDELKEHQKELKEAQAEEKSDKIEKYNAKIKEDEAEISALKEKLLKMNGKIK